MTLAGMKVVLDVQHLYREGAHAGDRGTLYTLHDGSRIWEADCALHYTQAAMAALRELGATVWTNDPAHAVLVGPYSRRQIGATMIGADVYLACHLNAGGGDYALTEYVAGGVNGSSELGAHIGDELTKAFPQIHHWKCEAIARPHRGVVCVVGFTRGPALIVEPLFGDNAAHQTLMSLQGLEAVGQALARGVASWGTSWRSA